MAGGSLSLGTGLAALQPHLISCFHSLFPECKCRVTSQPSALSFGEVTETEAEAASHVTSAVKMQGDGDSPQSPFSISNSTGFLPSEWALHS